MKANIAIIDCGRGPQLSTCRITLQDLVPYLQGDFSHEGIKQIMPILSSEEIQAVEQYVRDHHDEVMEKDRRIRERNAAMANPPEVMEIIKQARVERLALMAKLKKEQMGTPATLLVGE